MIASLEKNYSYQKGYQDYSNITVGSNQQSSKYYRYVDVLTSNLLSVKKCMI